MKLEEALFNWLQIRLAADGRPHDNAAKETADFFHTILTEDHRMSNLQVIEHSEDLLQVVYEIDGVMHKKSFDRGLAEQLLKDINENPKYNE